MIEFIRKGKIFDQEEGQIKLELKSTSVDGYGGKRLIYYGILVVEKIGDGDYGYSQSGYNGILKRDVENDGDIVSLEEVLVKIKKYFSEEEIEEIKEILK